MTSDPRPKTESEQVAFFAQCHERFLKAAGSAGAFDHFYQVAGATVRLMFAGEHLVPYVTPALEHLRVQTVDHPPDLTLCIWDTASTSIKMIPPPCTHESFTDRGEVWGFNSSRIKFAFFWTEYSVYLMDHSTKMGIYWVPKAEALPYWAQAAPLRTLFHWWMEKNGCQLLHGAAVGTDDGAVLLTGKGGVGKSTTALSCLRAGFRYLADDYVIVRLDPEPLAYSLYCTAKLNADHIVNFPQLVNLVRNPHKLDREKAVMSLYPQFESQIISAMPLKAVLVPELVNRGETRLTPAPSWKIQSATSFTTMSQLPHVGRHTLDFVRRLSSTVPGFALELAKDSSKVPMAISGLLERLGDDEANQLRLPSRPHDGADPTQRPLVSVIIPVFNGESFIKGAVESVLSQNYPALELIIVDDGSTDRTEQIISELPCGVRYFKQPNAGPAAARNRGIKDASGEYIAFLDVDDLWPENNLNSLVDELLRDPEIEVVLGYDQIMQRDPRSNDYEYVGNPEKTFPYSVAAGLYRKSVFANVGLFDSTLIFGEDTDWFVRAKESGVKIRRIEAVTLLVRRHGQNMTEGKDIVELNTLRVFKKVLDRRRGLGAPSKEV